MTEIENLEREIAEKQARLAELRAKEPDWGPAVRAFMSALPDGEISFEATRRALQAALPLAPVVGMSEELKPCPFCGCPLVGVSVPVDPRYKRSVKCPSCHSHGGWGDDNAEAIAAWNTRQSAQAETLAVLEQAREALEWYANLPAEWVLVHKNSTTRPAAMMHRYGDARLLGEKARQALTTFTAKIEEIRNGQG